MSVVCVGMYKTGTTSMSQALEILNFKHGIFMESKTTSFGNRKVGIGVKKSLLLSDSEIENSVLKHANWSKLKKSIIEGQNFGDGPWLHIYSKIYALKPDAKFILTLRDPVNLAKSDIDMWHRLNKGKSISQMTKGLVNNRKDLEKLIIKRYNKHVSDVRIFFNDKPNKLLEINIMNEDNPWIKICKFLNKPIPNIPFPYKNRKPN